MSEKTTFEHPVHMAVGECLRSYSKKFGMTCYLDPACGGSTFLPLFTDGHSRKTETCKVDALIVRENRIKLVVEIEESNIKPTQILGKYLTTAVSKHFTHTKLLGEGVHCPLSNSAFLQIAFLGNLPEGSQKPDQLELLRDEIKRRFIFPPIVCYELLLIHDRNSVMQQLTETLSHLLKT